MKNKIEEVTEKYENVDLIAITILNIDSLSFKNPKKNNRYLILLHIDIVNYT